MTPNAPVKIYGIKSCQSVRKALGFLQTYCIDFDFVDFRLSPVDLTQIREWVEQGAEINQLFNTRGTTYRTLGLKTKSLDENDKLEWMAKENLLIKRPVLIVGNTILVGYDASLYQKYLIPNQGE